MFEHDGGSAAGSPPAASGATALRLTPRHLADIRAVGPGNWSHDGRYIAFVRADPEGNPKLWIVASAGGAERPLVEDALYVEMSEGTDRRDVMGGPQWSPTHHTIAYLAMRADGVDPGIRLASTSHPNSREVLRHRAADRSPRWSPDGGRIAFVGHRDGRDELFVGELDGRPMQLTYDRWDNTDLDWSPDGTTLAFISQRSDIDLFSNSICIVPAAGGPVTRLTHDDRANDRSPRWSPDGITLAFVSNREDVDDIWLIASDGTQPRRLTSGPGDKGDPRWSPDGTRLAYTRYVDGAIVIQIITLDGRVVRGIGDQGCNLYPRWSPGGGQLLHSHSDHARPDDLWITDVDQSGARSRQLTNGSGEALAGMAFSRPSKETYVSRDGIEIGGLLYPRISQSQEAGPGILWIRGGPNAVHADGWHPLLQFFAQRGYTVFAPNYRGSTGSGRTFMESNYGSTTDGDVLDWLGAASFMRALPAVDSDRIAIMGRSYGGYAVLLTLGLHPSAFRAGIAFAAPSNWFTYWEDCELAWGRRLHIKLMGLPGQHWAQQTARSPITYADTYAAPVLILHGDADIGVPSDQAREMAARLQSLGKQHECVIYPAEGHVYSGRHAISDSAARIDEFLAAYLEAVPEVPVTAVPAQPETAG